MTSIPSFLKGTLPPGIWPCTADEFIERFCNGQYREHYTVTADEIFDYATSINALYILVGGSFVTEKNKPADLDCIIVFKTENEIPSRTERFIIDGVNLDIFFCSEDQPHILAAFLEMFSETRNGSQRGVVQVTVENDNSDSTLQSLPKVDAATLTLVKSIYFGRHVVNRNNQRKAIITIHGIKSHGEWNAEIAHIASSSGWIIAPFTYGYTEPSILAKSNERNKIIDAFREHINDINDTYSCHVSIIAHSFGTYIATKYLLGFDTPPVCIDTLILTGSILNETLDIDRFKRSTFKVINEVAPNDSVVKYASLANYWNDELLGASGEKGFSSSSAILEQRTCDVSSHTNVIRRDVISKRWMPWLEANVGRGPLGKKLKDFWGL